MTNEVDRETARAKASADFRRLLEMCEEPADGAFAAAESPVMFTTQQKIAAFVLHLCVTILLSVGVLYTVYMFDNSHLPTMLVFTFILFWPTLILDFDNKDGTKTVINCMGFDLKIVPKVVS